MFNNPQYNQTVAYEKGLHKASAALLQLLALQRAGIISNSADDYNLPRLVVATYLKSTGRLEEANEVLAIGCNAPPNIEDLRLAKNAL
jgi:hypothetical protein